MQNSNLGWGDVGGARQQTQKSDVDSVLDAFNNILAANSDALLTTTWGKKKGEYEPRGSETASRSTWGEAYNSTTSNQDESEKSWSSWGNNSWDTNSGWGNEDNNVRNYPMNNSEYQNSAYADKDMNKDVDAIRPNPGVNSNRPNQSDNNIDMYMNNDSQSGNWQTPERPQSSQEINSPPEPDPSTDHNSETVDQDSIQMKLLAWRNIADPNAKRLDGDKMGSGQLHREGRNYIPVSEETVLAIQNGGIKRNRRGPEKSKIRSAPNVPQNQVGRPPMRPSQKSSTPLKSDIKDPIKTSVPPNQRQNTQPIPPNRTQQQSSQPQSPWDSSKSSRDNNSISSQPQQPQQSQKPQQSQQPQQPQQSQRPQQSQQPQKPQQPQQSQKPQQPQQPQKPQQSQQSQKSQGSWETNLVNEPFWDLPSKTSPNIQNQPQSNSSPRQYANEVATTGGQYRPPRHQSPARSPRPAKSLPFIPPEFDSTPYRRQRTPSPIRDTFNGYNNSGWDSNRVYEDDDQQNEYYEDSDFEERDDKFSGYGNRLIDRKDRGQLLLTINVEFEEGKTQAIKVHENDNPLDLAKEFCDLFKVTNDMVMPALECLIKEEKEKRLGYN